MIPDSAILAKNTAFTLCNLSHSISPIRSETSFSASGSLFITETARLCGQCPPSISSLYCGNRRYTIGSTRFATAENDRAPNLTQNLTVGRLALKPPGTLQGAIARRAIIRCKGTPYGVVMLFITGGFLAIVAAKRLTSAYTNS